MRTCEKARARLDGTIVVDGGRDILHSVGTQQRYISHDGRLAFGMPLGADRAVDPVVYDWFARRYLLRDRLPMSKLGNYHDTEALHPAWPDRGVPELSALPADATHWILREVDGTAWLLDGESRLHLIVDEPTYVRLAQRYFVRDHTPPTQIDVFGVGRPVSLGAPTPSTSSWGPGARRPGRAGRARVHPRRARGRHAEEGQASGVASRSLASTTGSIEPSTSRSS